MGEPSKKLEILGAIPLASHDDGSFVSAFSVEDGVDSMADSIATRIALNTSSNETAQAIAYNTVHYATSYAMLEIAQFLFDTAGGLAGGNTLGFSIAQLKVMIKRHIFI